jgi:hypothetical protein
MSGFLLVARPLLIIIKPTMLSLSLSPLSLTLSLYLSPVGSSSNQRWGNVVSSADDISKGLLFRMNDHNFQILQNLLKRIFKLPRQRKGSLKE